MSVIKNEPVTIHYDGLGRINDSTSRDKRDISDIGSADPRQPKQPRKPKAKRKARARAG